MCSILAVLTFFASALQGAVPISPTLVLYH